MRLLIHACVREDSRTARLADALLEKLGGADAVCDLTRERPEALTRETLEKRTALIEAGDFGDPMFRFARQFAAADEIVLAAPYWDLGFPAVLKAYLEQIYVTGLTSRYDERGVPVGLCRAKKLWYVTTAGGPFLPDFSYDYVRTLATVCFGIPETELVYAEGLDVWGSDPEAILRTAIDGLNGEEKKHR